MEKEINLHIHLSIIQNTLIKKWHKVKTLTPTKK